MSAFDGLGDIFVTTFGQPVTVTPTGGSARTITAIYKAPQEIDTLEGGTVTTPSYIRARSADVADLAYNDAVVVAGESFRVGSIRADSRAMTHIALKK